MKRFDWVQPGWSWLCLSLFAACGSDAGAAPWIADNAAGSAAGSGTGGAAGASGDPGSGGGLGDPSWCGVKQTLDARCTACHNEQKTAGAPMSLTTYASTQAAAVSDAHKKVYQLIGVRVHDSAAPMPPQRKLTAEQLAGIDAWVAAGAPAGDDPTCSGTQSEPPPSADSWPTNCDATYTILSHADGSATAPYSVPAGDELHPNVTVPAPWGNEAMQGIAFRPITQNPKILHHWILYGPKREFLVGWAPGKDTTPLPADVGMNLAGGNLTLNLHYNNLLGTETESDRSGVEICVLKQANFRKNTAAVHTGFSQLSIEIPAHATNFEVSGRCTVSETMPVTVFSASPHAHKLAHHMKFTIQKASGETIVMHDDDFDFNEQQSYPLSPAVQLVSGDKVTTSCTYDNPSNQPVRFGENTENEMCFNFAQYYPMGALKCGFAFSGNGS